MPLSVFKLALSALTLAAEATLMLCNTSKEIDEMRQQFLSANGRFKQLYRGIKSIAESEKKAARDAFAVERDKVAKLFEIATTRLTKASAAA